MTRPIRFLLPALMLLVSARISAGEAPEQPVTDDAWILPGDPVTPTVLALNLGADGTASRSLSAYLLAPLGGQARMDLAWSRTRLNNGNGDFDSDDFDARLGWSAGPAFDLSGGYRFQGQSGVLELAQFSLGLSYHRERFALDIEGRSGSLTLYARKDLPVIRHGYPDHSVSNLQAWFVQFTLFRNDDSFYLSRLDYQYDRDPARLGRSRLLQRIVAAGVFEQSGLLIAEQTRLGFSHSGRRLDSRIEWSRSRNAVDLSEQDSLLLDLRYPLNPEPILLLGVGYALASSDPWSLSAGMEWSFY